MKTETKKARLVKSPLSGYWLLYPAPNERTIELAVKTKKAAINKTHKKGYTNFSIEE